MDAKTKDLWVLIETGKDETPRKAGLELLSPGRRLADKQEGKLVTVVIGCRTEASVQTAGEYRTDGIIVVDSEEFKEYSTDVYTAALTFLVGRYGPTTMFIGATPTGHDLGPRFSCRLKTGLTADCTSLDVDTKTDSMAWTRPAFGGNLTATILYSDCRPQLGTVRLRILKKPKARISRAEIIEETYSLPKEKIRTTVLEIIREATSEAVNLKGAEIVVSGDRGLGGPDGFKLVCTLANVLGITVGTSKAAVDAGWISRSHQVEQTGKTVAPKIYVTCGISGAIQYVAGMSGADCVITINKGPGAPIFGITGHGIVRNLFEATPVIMEEIRKARA